MVDYTFYRSQFLGRSLTEEEWSEFSPRALAQLNQYKRTYTVTSPEARSEDMAVCAMTEVVAAIAAAQSGTGTIAAASIGSVSVSYGNAAAAMDLSPKGQARELYNAASMYLDIYRGVGVC